MAASMICTRTVPLVPDSFTRFAAAPLRTSLESARVGRPRWRLCALQERVPQSRPIRFGTTAGSSQIRKRSVVREQRNVVSVRAEGGDRGRDGNRDEDGVIKDMELYLDDLSLEYDSVWDTKPAWCQPWTIVITGLGVIGGSWLSFQNAFVTGGACFFIGFWWFSFLYAYPLAYTEMIAERRKNVKSGSEDTFGTRRVQ